MEVIANHLVNKMVQEHMISDDEEEWFLYSVQMILEKIVGYFSILVLGVIFKNFFQTVAFIIVFSGVRKYSGGFHFKKSWICYLFSIGVYFVFILGIRNMMLEFTLVPMLLLTFTCLGIYFIGAENNEELHWDRKEYLNNVILTRISITIIFGTIVGLKAADINDSYLWFMFFGVFLSFVGLFLQKIKNIRNNFI